jgi:predicted Zn-dependent protease/TolB-like protein
VKVMQRRALTTVALTLGVLSAPVAVEGQTRTVAPNPDTPRLLVAVFASNDRASGVQAADAIRTRVTSVSNIKQLYVIPKNDITNYLESSGYKADSSLGQTDLKELAKLLRADEILSGTATRTGTTLRIEPRLMLARDPALAQPLPRVDAANVGDAARQIEKLLGEARKQLADNKACENAIRDKQYDKAMASANAGIAKYPNATIARLCLATAYQEKKSGPDSVLRVTDEILRIDPKNSFALRQAYAAYEQKGDQERAVRSLVGLLALEPSNPTLQAQVVAALARLGRPTVAIPIIDTLLLQNPGDPQLLRQKWLLLLNSAAGDTTPMRLTYFSQALTAGEDMVRIDTTLADSSYYERQIGAASGITDQPQRALEISSRAVQRFPNNAYFWRLKAQSERKAGQLQQARESMARALSIDPKSANANLFMAQLALDLNQPDTAIAIARRAISTGEDAKTWGAFLLGPTQAAFKKAQDSKSIDEYRRALALAQESDKLSASPTAKFFIGVSAFSVGIDALQDAQKRKNCPLARSAQEMMLLTQINMPAGGQVDAATAKTILDYVATYAPAADQMVKQYCKR